MRRGKKNRQADAIHRALDLQDIRIAHFKNPRGPRIPAVVTTLPYGCPLKLRMPMTIYVQLIAGPQFVATHPEIPNAAGAGINPQSAVEQAIKAFVDYFIYLDAHREQLAPDLATEHRALQKFFAYNDLLIK